MNKFYIVYAHPNHQGHHACFLKAILKRLDETNENYEVLDLYAINYDPVLKSDELYSSGQKTVNEQNIGFQKKIKESNRLLFIYPTWWGGMPAILKGWIDRVFVGGFGFVYKLGIPIGQLKGKKAAVFSASGSPELYSLLITREQAVRTMTHDVLRFCGLEAKSFRLGSAKILNKDSELKIDNIANKVYQYLTS